MLVFLNTPKNIVHTVFLNNNVIIFYYVTDLVNIKFSKFTYIKLIIFIQMNKFRSHDAGSQTIRWQRIGLLQIGFGFRSWLRRLFRILPQQNLLDKLLRCQFSTLCLVGQCRFHFGFGTVFWVDVSSIESWGIVFQLDVKLADFFASVWRIVACVFILWNVNIEVIISFFVFIYIVVFEQKKVVTNIIS